MLRTISIQNYALIDKLEINFNNGLTIITGETGAGKSIILGALSLIVGNRADSSTLKMKDKKCVIEAEFDISEYNLQDFFKSNDLECFQELIIRRELSPNGKSRSFINDELVNLYTLKELGNYLVDIHSQHQNLILGQTQFQLQVIDVIANSQSLMVKYRQEFKIHQQLNLHLNNILEKSEQAKKELDYFQFQYDQLEKAKLIHGEQGQIEEELEILEHAEDIKTNLIKTHQLISGEGNSILTLLHDAISSSRHLGEHYSKGAEMQQRLESVEIELSDIASEAEQQAEEVEFNPERINFLNQRLNLIYDLQQKHRVKSVDELLKIQEELEKQLNEINSYDDQINDLKAELESQRINVHQLATQLSEKRKKTIPTIEKKVVELLKQLGMPNANFKIRCEKGKEYSNNGIDVIDFMFSANNKMEVQEIGNTASGGEISRLMLSIKSLISEKASLPTIIFDEIDSGISGEIAAKVGKIIHNLSKNIQVLNITHLPQIASKGPNHLLVYKKEDKHSTSTHIKYLNEDERIVEIARMLSGENPTNAALENAKELISD